MDGTTISSHTILLREAVFDTDFDRVLAAIQNGADVNCMIQSDGFDLFRSYQGLPEEQIALLCLAVMKGSVEIIRKLVNAGANVNLKGSKCGLSPLHVAAKKGDVKVLEELLSGDFDVNIKDAQYNGAPIHYAAFGGHLGILKSLIAVGADINAKMSSGETAIFAAMNPSLVFSDKCLGVLCILIQNGAVIETSNWFGYTPLMWMYAFNRCLYLDVIKEMIKNWLNLCTSDRKALFVELLETITNMEILQVFKDKRNRCVLSVQDEFSRTVLHNTVSLGHHDALKTLMSFGVDASVTDAHSQTLLHCAIPIGNEEIIKDLIDNKCDLKAVDQFGRSVLHLAAFYGHCKLIELFISKGLNPDDVDFQQRNSIHYAVINRQEEAVKVLIQVGTNCDQQRDSTGLKPCGYLHACEEICHVSQQLLGDVVQKPVLLLTDDEDFDLEIAGIPSLLNICSIPGIGSVDFIQDFNMCNFQSKIREKMHAIVSEATPILSWCGADLIGCGSSAEGSKVGLPNEVDFLISFQSWVSEATNPHEGYMDMKISNLLSRVTHWSQSVWLWHLLTTWWTQQQKGNSTMDGNFQMPFAPVRHPEHATCVNWVWLYTDDVFKMLPVSIDLVVAAETKSHISKATWLVKDDELEKFSSYIVPKVPEESYLKAHFHPVEFGTLGRISYPPLECRHFISLDKQLKNVYITAKCLRLPEVCAFKIQDVNGDFHIAGDYITSFRLKMVFLHLVEVFLKCNLSLGGMVLVVYEVLEFCLERKKLPMFLRPEINVLAGSRSDPKEGLRVARVMTKFVRKLYERDFQAALAQDAVVAGSIPDLIPECLTW